MPLPASSLILTVLVSKQYGQFFNPEIERIHFSFRKKLRHNHCQPSARSSYCQRMGSGSLRITMPSFGPGNPFDPTNGHISVKVSDNWGLTFSVVGRDVVCVDDQDCIF